MMPKKSLTSLVVLTLLSLEMFVLADTSESRGTYILDTSADRRPAKTSFPKYPAIARRDRIEGEATVCFSLDKRGKVKRASIKSYTHKIFRRPVLRAIRKSTFESLLPGQVLSKTKACRTYRFKLDPIATEETGG